MLKIKLFYQQSKVLIRNKVIREEQSKKIIKMEECNDEITGWDDTDIKILNSKTIKKHTKKITHSIVTEPQHMGKKINASRTLPFIKKKPSLLQETIVQALQKKQPTHLDKLHQILQDRIIKAKKANLQKQCLDCLDNFYTSRITTIQQEQTQFDLKNPKEFQNQHNSSFQKKSNQLKHGSAIVKMQKIERFQKLKIQANQYVSSTKNSPRLNGQKTLIAKKITKGSLTNLRKKQKNKHFVVEKQRLSAQQLLQEVSKMAIELRKSRDEDIKHSTSSQKKQNRGYLIKEKYKDLINSTEIQKEKKNNSILVKSRSQQLKNSTHVRRNTNFDVGRSAHKNDSKIVACRQNTIHECIGWKQQEGTVKKVCKWNQVLKQVENEAKTLKKLKDHRKKLFKAVKQASTGLLPNFNQKAEMLETMVTKRLRKNIIKAEFKVINNLKKKMMTELNHGEDNDGMKKQKKIITEGSTCYDEFNDECLFNNRGGKQNTEEIKIYRCPKLTDFACFNF